MGDVKVVEADKIMQPEGKGPLTDLKIKVDLKKAFNEWKDTQWLRTNEWKTSATKWLKNRSFMQLAIALLVVLAIAGAVAGYDEGSGANFGKLTMIADGMKNISAFIMAFLCVFNKDKNRRLTDLGWVILAIAIPQVTYCAVWLALILDLVSVLATRGFMIDAATVQRIGMFWAIAISGVGACFIMLKASKKQYPQK